MRILLLSLTAASLFTACGARDVPAAERGRRAYQTYCVGCHGENGDGNGPAARFLDPKPRDFRTGKLKFATVPAGSTPTDHDYFHTITHGLSGTAMPSWHLVPMEDRKALVAYVKGFHPGWAEAPAPAPTPLPDDPFVKDPARGVKEGERVYHGFANCWSCHPAYVPPARIGELAQSYGRAAPEVRADLYQALVKESDWGAPLRAPDFLVDRLKFGNDPERLAEVIVNGVGGTAMPTWGAALTPEQLWGLVYYVESLARLRGTAEGRARVAERSAAP